VQKKKLPSVIALQDDERADNVSVQFAFRVCGRKGDRKMAATGFQCRRGYGRSSRNNNLCPALTSRLILEGLEVLSNGLQTFRRS